MSTNDQHHLLAMSYRSMDNVLEMLRQLKMPMVCDYACYVERKAISSVEKCPCVTLSISFPFPFCAEIDEIEKNTPNKI